MANSLSDAARPALFPLADLHVVHAMRAWFVGLGLALLALGLLAIFLPFAASLVTTEVIGWLLIAGAILQGVHAAQNRRWAGSTWAVAGAGVTAIAGVLVAGFPVAGTLTLTLILAAFFVVEGMLKIVRALQHRQMRAYGWFVFDGVLSLFLGGLILFGWPGTAVWAIGLLVGVNFAISGASLLMIGLGAGGAAAPR